MKSKKIISILLIVVFVLQLLPVKHAVRFFCFDNPIAEEIIDINESAEKKINNAIEDDHFFMNHLYLLHTSLLVNRPFFGLYTAMLPSSPADKIETPPPNVMII